MLSEKIIDMMASAGQRKLLIASESSERLRKVIGKERIKNDDIIRYIDIAATKGISDIGLYFIIGLPGEQQSDWDEIIKIIFLVGQHMNQLGHKTGHLKVGVNPLFPNRLPRFSMLQLHILKRQKKNWKDCLANHNLIASDFFRGYFFTEKFPWEFEKCLVSTDHLVNEYSLAMQFKPSPSCSADCSKCESRCIT